MARDAGHWWQRIPEVIRVFESESRQPFDGVWYQLANGLLGISSDDRPLAQRFEQIYSEAAVPAPAESSDLPSVRCIVRSAQEQQTALVAFRDDEALDAMRFCRTLFPDRGYVPGPACAGGWESIAAADAPKEPFGVLRGDLALVDLTKPWQSFIANYAVNRVLRRQREMLFFHAASLAVSGNGVMLVGSKGSGKTTTAMSLASRGAGFFGDEVAAVCVRTGFLLPFRRAVSIKPGPRAWEVESRVAAATTWVEQFPDGSVRTLVPMGNLFPESRPTPAQLACVFFLEGFQPQASVRQFAFGREHYRLLTPLASSMWGVPAPIRMMQIAHLLKSVACFSLSPGQPEETAELVERTVLECQV